MMDSDFEVMKRSNRCSVLSLRPQIVRVLNTRPWIQPQSVPTERRQRVGLCVFGEGGRVDRPSFSEVVEAYPALVGVDLEPP